MQFCISLLLLCTLKSFDACATDKAQKNIDQGAAFVYHPAATEQLREICVSLKGNTDYEVRQDYLSKRHKIRYLLYMGGDPNANTCPEHGSDFCTLCNLYTSSLCRALAMDDAEITRLSLKCGANPRKQHNRIPLAYAQSVKTAQLLIQHGAKVPKNIVSCSVGANSELLGLFCQSKKQKYFNETLLLRLYRITGAYKKNHVSTTGVFLWFGLDPCKRISMSKNNFYGNSSYDEIEATPLDILAESSPELVNQVQILTTLVPQVKREKEEQYMQSIESLLNPYISRDPARLAIEYAQPFAEPAWDKTRWPEISTRMKQIEAKNTSSRCSVS